MSMANHGIKYGVLSVSGIDAPRFLHGQCTQDIQGMQDGEVRHAFVLTPKGKILADFYVKRIAPEAFVLAVSAERAEFLVAHLKKYIIMQKVVISREGEDLTPSWLPAHALYDERERVLKGIPIYGKDFDENNLPQETGLFECLHFNKGCYTGQEIVARLHFRGHVTKCLAQIEFSGTDLSEAIVSNLHFIAGDKRVGPMTSVARRDETTWCGMLYLPYAFFESGELGVVPDSPDRTITVMQIRKIEIK